MTEVDVLNKASEILEKKFLKGEGLPARLQQKTSLGTSWRIKSVKCSQSC